MSIHVSNAELISVSDDSNFVSRKDIVAWVNGFLGLGYTRVEDTASAAAHCQLLDALYPGQVPLHQVNFDAKFEHEFMQNFKILQRVLLEQGVQKHVEVQKLVKARYLDNFEFLRWMKAFFERQWDYTQAYDARGRREAARKAFRAQLPHSDSSRVARRQAQAVQKLVAVKEQLQNDEGGSSSEQQQQSSSEQPSVAAAGVSRPVRSRLIPSSLMGKQQQQGEEAQQSQARPEHSTPAPRAPVSRVRKAPQPTIKPDSPGVKRSSPVTAAVPTAVLRSHERKAATGNTKTVAAAAAAAKMKMKEGQKMKEGEERAEAMSSGGRSQSNQASQTQLSKIRELTQELQQLRETAALLKQDRDFYFGVLRSIELRCEQEESGQISTAELQALLYPPEQPTL